LSGLDGLNQNIAWCFPSTFPEEKCILNSQLIDPCIFPCSDPQEPCLSISATYLLSVTLLLKQKRNQKKKRQSKYLKTRQSFIFNA